MTNDSVIVYFPKKLINEGSTMIHGIPVKINDKFIVQDLQYKGDELRNGDICTYVGHRCSEDGMIAMHNDRNGYRFVTYESRLKRI